MIYVVVVALALAAGLMLGIRVDGSLRWVGATAAALVLVGLVAGSLVVEVDAWFAGPVFAIVAAVTSVLVAAEARRDEPAFVSETYGRRVLLAMRTRTSTHSADPQ
ncbi:hypothetical protein [Microbacterium sp. NPDC089695]|uniref:hypothetical protein n=1 Tax=Microbacterium sp. NPDC089695 TaxID=3364198 RepID=UPI0038267FD5